MLPKDTIAVEPPRGWFGAQTNHSLTARKWLSFENHMRQLESEDTENPVLGDRIRHADNGGEVRVFTPAQSYLVDGYDEVTKTVYEFNGCLWHGCPVCFPQRNQYSKLNQDRTFAEMYDPTLTKAAILRNNGYKVESMWSCQWKYLEEEDDFVKDFMLTWKPTEPLNPRNAFFGGRTNAVSLYYKADESVGEKIYYVDVTSLYP